MKVGEGLAYRERTKKRPAGRETNRLGMEKQDRERHIELQGYGESVDMIGKC